MPAAKKSVSKSRKPATRETVTKVIEPEFEPDDLDDPIEGELDEPDDIEIANLLSELGDEEVMVRIYRQAPNSRKLTLCNAIPIKEFDPMMLAYPPYNGGTFRIHARGKSGALTLNRILDVEKRTPEAPAQSTGGVTREDVASIVVQALAQFMGNQPKPQTRAEMLEEIKIMAEITKGNTPPPTPPQSLQDQIGLVTSLITISKALNPAPPIAGDEGGLLSTIVSKGADLMGSAMAAARAGAQLNPAALAAPGPAASATPEGLTEPVEPELTEEEQENMVLIRLALKTACRAAVANEDPQVFADENYDMIPDDVLDTMIADPQWFEQICKVVPGCAAHRPWFEAVKVRIAAMYAEDVTSDNDNASSNLDKPGEPAQTPGNVNTPAAPTA